MTLSEFMDMWTRGNRTVVICKAEYFDDMFDLVDMLNEGHAKIEDCRNWMECAVLPYITQFCAAYYLHPKYAYSKVENFFIGDTYVIVWCDLNDQKMEENNG